MQTIIVTLENGQKVQISRSSDKIRTEGLTDGIRGLEIYMKNPETGEDGWDIEFIDIFSDQYMGRKLIRETLDKHLPNFDCVITW